MKFYVKVNFLLQRLDEEIGDLEQFTVSTIYEMRNHLTQRFNDCLLDYTIDKWAFCYRQELRLENLAKYSDDEVIRQCAIIPIHIEQDWLNEEYIDKDIVNFSLYLQVEILAAVSKNDLFDFIKGQLSDGWGENLSLEFYDYKTMETITVYPKFIYDSMETTSKIFTIDDYLNLEKIIEKSINTERKF